MGKFIDNDITTVGKALHAKALTGGIFEATRIVMGSGYMPTGKKAATMTEVVTPVISLEINKIKRANNGMVTYGGVYSNKEIQEDFFFREYALYARAKYVNEETGAVTYDDEVLYTYGNAGDNADLMVAYSTSSVVERQMDLVTWIGNEVEITLEIASGVYITRELIGVPDGVAGLDVGGNLNMKGARVTGLGDPSGDTDAVHKGFVEKIVRSYSTVRNLLDNSDFSNPVNQRGQKLYKFSIDEWECENYSSICLDRWNLSSDMHSLELVDGGVVLQTLDSPVEEPRVALRQVLPAGTVQIGKKYTAAIGYLDGSVYCVSFDAVSDRTPDFSLDTDVFRFETRIQWFEIKVPHDRSMALAWAALYEGEFTVETLPPYIPKGYAAELAECQRYWIRYGVDGVINIGYAQCLQNGTANGILYLPVPMQGKPSYHVLNGAVKLVSGDNEYPVDAVSVNHVHHNICSLDMSAEGITVGGIYSIQLADAAIEFRADLW